MRNLINIFVLLFLFSCSKHTEPAIATPETVSTTFVIPIFPDTQEAVTRNNAMFTTQCDWIARVKDSLNIPLALHVGDLVNFDTIPQYQTASNIMKRLDDRNVPYVIAVGNHDTGAVLPNSGSAAPGNVNANLRNTTKFNSFFPTSRFKLQKGVFEANKSDNAFHQFTAANKKWMVINLEFCARESAVKWADSIISVYPDFNTIVLTHYHLTPTGEINTTNAGYGNMKCSDIFNKYLKNHKNLLMVLSGHVCYAAQRSDLGTNGNTIYSILQNYQCEDSGGGYLRLLQIDTKQGTISGKMFSPFYNTTKSDISTQFTFSNVKFVGT